MLSAFKIKPFELEPTYASWTDGPKFTGNPKKDLPVEEWLEVVKAGCVERKVPKEYWHKVAQHFMGDKAKARLDEVKIIMAKVHGGNFRWDWKKYKVAMRNMGWDIDTSVLETVKVKAKSSMWWLTRKTDDEKDAPERPTPVRSSTFWNPPKRDEKENVERPLAVTTKSDSHWTTRKPQERERPVPVKSKTMADVVSLRKESQPPAPSRSNSIDNTVTTVAQAPTWLLNACGALEFLTTEHPKVMTTLSAILITIGSIPAIPAISAGAGGAILASGAAHAAGAVAVGLGTWIKAQQDGHMKTTAPQAN